MWDLSPPTRDWTHVPCTGRWILNHWTTREVPQPSFNKTQHARSCSGYAPLVWFWALLDGYHCTSRSTLLIPSFLVCWVGIVIASTSEDHGEHPASYCYGSEHLAKGHRAKNCTCPLGTESSPRRQPGRRWKPQSDNHEELNSASYPASSEVDPELWKGVHLTSWLKHYGALRRPS